MVALAVAATVAFAGCRREDHSVRRAVEPGMAAAAPSSREGGEAPSLAGGPSPTGSPRKAGSPSISGPARPGGPAEFVERAARVEKRVNAACGAANVLVLGESGFGTASDGAMMITVDFSVAAQVDEDALACLYAGECARLSMERVGGEGPRGHAMDARVSAPRPAHPPGINGGARGPLLAAWLRDSDELTGRIVARAGYRADGFGEAMEVVRSKSPGKDELAPFWSAGERRESFLKGYAAEQQAHAERAGA